MDFKTGVDIYSLPPAFVDDIKEYQEALKNGELIANEIWTELYGWINSFKHEYSITKEQADELREKLLYSDDEEIINAVF